jgi:predicted transcriptional regulator
MAAEGRTGVALSRPAPTLVVMSLSVQLPDELAERLAAEAAARHQSPEQVALEAIEAALPARRRLSFSGIGRSSDGRGGAQADELIAEHFAHKTARDL